MEWNLRFSLSNPIDPHIDHKVNIQMSNFMKFAGRKGGSLGRLQYIVQSLYFLNPKFQASSHLL